MSDVRPPAIAGRFYPSDPDELARLVDRCLKEARRPDHPGVPKAIIAPHAGFVFSGPIAGSAFSTWADARDRIRRVVVIGPSHHVAFEGVATSRYDVFRTPLGGVPVDTELRDRCLEFDFVQSFEEAHDPEHSLETHLPFLQRVLDDFVILPLVAGRVDRKRLATLLDAVWGDDETVVSVSSDLSHFHDYDTARRRDEATSDAIVHFRPEQIGPRDACGAVPVNALLHTAGARGMDAEVFDLRNSGDTHGDRSRVVGYGAYAFWE